MTTQLTKPIRRRTEAGKFDRGKLRRYVITLYPGDLIGFRLEKCRHEEFLPIGVAYNTAIRLRIAKEREEKRSGKKRLVSRGKL